MKRCAAVLSLLCLLVPAGVLAQRTSSLGWVRLPGAESCIATQALAERVEQRLGRRAFVSASQADLALEGRVERDQAAGAWVATLVMSDRQGRVLGKRVLRAVGEGCEVLDDSLTLVIAIAIDPGASLAAALGGQGQLSEQGERLIEQLELPELDDRQLLQELTVPVPEGEPEPTPEPAPAAHPAAQPKSGDAPGLAAAPPAAPATTVELALAGLGALGPLPRPAWGLSLLLALRPPSFWTLELDVELLPPRELRVSDGAIDFALLSAGVFLCPLSTAPAELELRVCAGARLGALAAAGQDFARDQTPSGIWAEAGIRARMLWNFNDFFVQGELALGAALVRDRFRYLDRDIQPREAHRPGPLSGRLGLGAGVRFR